MLDKRNCPEKRLLIPHEVIEAEILKRLPVKTLIRFRCVCKSWFQHIYSRDFANLHQSAEDDDYHLIVAHRVCDGKSHIAIFHSESLAELLFFANPDALDRTSLVLEGCSRGLICIYGFNASHSFLYLFNPIRGQLKRIDHRIKPSQRFRVCHAFCYDSQNNDYKVVRMMYEGYEFYQGSTEVYSLNTNSWKASDCSASLFARATRPIYRVDYGYWNKFNNVVLVNGAFHWQAETSLRGDVVIPSFHFGDEVFGEISLPDLINTDYFLLPYKNKLAFITDANTKPCTHYFWVMKEYGVTESWTILYKIGPQPGLYFHYQIRRFGNNENQFIFIKDGATSFDLYYVTYDSIITFNKTRMVSTTRVLKHAFEAFTFKPSLYDLAT